MYAFRDASKRFGRQGIDALERHLSVVKATETAAGSSVRYEATAGMPVGADIAFRPQVVIRAPWTSKCGSTSLALTNENGTMAVAMDAQEKLFDAVMSFVARRGERRRRQPRRHQSARRGDLRARRSLEFRIHGINSFFMLKITYVECLSRRFTRPLPSDPSSATLRNKL